MVDKQETGRGKLNTSLAAFLKRERARSNMSQWDLARASGVSHAFISDLERGVSGNPSAKTLTKLAKALRVPDMEIFAAAGGVELESSFGMEPQLMAEVQRLPANVQIAFSRMLREYREYHEGKTSKIPA